MENEKSIKKGKLDSFVKKSFFILFSLFFLFFISFFMLYYSPYIFKEEEETCVDLEERVKINYKLNYSFEEVGKEIESMNAHFKNLDETNLEQIIFSFLFDDSSITFEECMDSFEKYIKGKNFCFKYNTVFISVGGKDLPCMYFDKDYIYIDLSVWSAARYEDLIEMCQSLIETLSFLDFSDDAIHELLIEFNASEYNEVAVVFLSMTFSAKPVIYLYPEEKTNITVKLDNVNFTTTYPEYKENWSVTAYPDGTLIDENDREYNYLYWEGYTKPFVDISEGFVVAKEDYIEFFETTLKRVGLTDKEACDFISYWLPYMNEFEYCLVTFQMENYEEQVKLDFSVKPDNELRVFVAFKGLDNPIEIEEQDLSYYNGFERTGFTVVEWGGTIIE